nr:molecular chaperone [uncultured Enterobacter sp.]
MFNKVLKTVACGMLFLSAGAISGIEIGGTRLIYDGASSQAAISVSNPDNKPFLIQSWVSSSDIGDDNDTAFIATPPLFRLNAGAKNAVRVMLTRNTLPSDRESIYWLNIKAIPSSSPDAKNELLIAVKSKMKLIYRPPGLKGDPLLAYQKLQFTRKGGVLIVHNPTPFSVSLYDVKINGKPLAKSPTALPFQSVSLPVAVNAGGEISWRAINDFGGVTVEQKTKT